MKTKIMVLTLCATLFALSFSAEPSSRRGKFRGSGFYATASGATELPYIEAFRLGLRELGYVEGKNINIEYRYAEGKFERLPELAEELVRLKVESLSYRAQLQPKRPRNRHVTIPIVMTRAGDPLQSRACG